MTTKDVLALALEALKLAEKALSEAIMVAPLTHLPPSAPAAIQVAQTAVTAIKQAQQQPEKTALDFFIEDTQAHCPYCDGTGDVHSPDGEFQGVCQCDAGKKILDSLFPLKQSPSTFVEKNCTCLSGQFGPDYCEVHSE